MKLGTHVPRNNTHVYIKSHNSGLNNYTEMPLFDLEKSRGNLALTFAALVTLSHVQQIYMNMANIWKISIIKSLIS